MKYKIVIPTLLLFILSGCVQTLSDSSPPSEDLLIGKSVQEKPNPIKLNGISFQAPDDFQYALEQTTFTSFKDYANHVESTLMKELIIQVNRPNQLTDAEIEAELKKFKGRYSFERKKVNGFDLLVHRRDFFVLFGELYEVHIYLENNKVLILADLDHDRLDRVLSTIKK